MVADIWISQRYSRHIQVLHLLTPDIRIHPHSLRRRNFVPIARRHGVFEWSRRCHVGIDTVHGLARLLTLEGRCCGAGDTGISENGSSSHHHPSGAIVGYELIPLEISNSSTTSTSTSIGELHHAVWSHVHAHIHCHAHLGGASAAS